MENRFSKFWIKDIIIESFDSEPVNNFIEYVNSFYGRDGIYRLMKTASGQLYQILRLQLEQQLLT